MKKSEKNWKKKEKKMKTIKKWKVKSKICEKEVEKMWNTGEKIKVKKWKDENM